MASHGNKRHTKRIASPKILPIERKKTLWIMSNRPGPHGQQDSIPLLLLLRDVLKVCISNAEAKKLLHNGQVLIDGRAIRDVGFPVGLMDIVSLKDHGSFIIVINKGGKLSAVKTDQVSQKLCKITGKRIITGGKVQLTLHDGRNLIVPSGKEYSVGDTLKISIPKAEIKEHLKLEKGSKCYVFRGRHAGAIGALVDIHVFSGVTPSNAKILDGDKKEVVTLKDYVFVVDKNFKI
ncbi:MAG: 30S ribosomal protein S4e [Candidatus Micrarchaeota archaeon]|nr:30S ribosomal protein S4e [Candidatus Micrarchaeota archaeon]